MAKQKIPRVREDVRPLKKPRIAPDPSHNNHFLSWHISLIETVGPFGWHVLELEKLLEIRGKLGSFEGKTWNEFLVAEKSHNHTVPVDQLCAQARRRLEEIGQDDVHSLISLRLSGRERIWGIRQQHILKILWWDPDHQVCPSAHKHT